MGKRGLARKLRREGDFGRGSVELTDQSGDEVTGKPRGELASDHTGLCFRYLKVSCTAYAVGSERPIYAE